LNAFLKYPSKNRIFYLQTARELVICVPLLSKADAKVERVLLSCKLFSKKIEIKSLSKRLKWAYTVQVFGNQ
jgi:hypothetical protein